MKLLWFVVIIGFDNLWFFYGPVLIWRDYSYWKFVIFLGLDQLVIFYQIVSMYVWTEGIFPMNILKIIPYTIVYISLSTRSFFPNLFSSGTPFLSTNKTDCQEWLVQNQDSVSEWSDMFTCGLLFQWASTENRTKQVGLVQDFIIIS